MNRQDDFRSSVCVTAQHREMLDQVTALFQIPVDHDLNVMAPNQTLDGLTARMVERFSAVVSEIKPDVVLVQGDTTTTFVASLVAFYQHIAVAHVEAGLRTNDRNAPFPEEMNRRLTTQLADLHFPPTPWSRDNLLREGIPADRIHVTGNTVVDVLLRARKVIEENPPRIEGLPELNLKGRRLILVTAHRRENFGDGIKNICRALKQIVIRHPEVEVVYPVHPNPNVLGPVTEYLAGLERVHLIRPQSYLPFVWLMSKASLVLSDSGGVQEEMPSFGRPVLVLRDKTERPEGVEAGVCRLVGTDTARIVTTVEGLLKEADSADAANAKNPFGDGKASLRIADGLLAHFGAKRSETYA
jgi:UDP-N-acetylglucosamine 2-epimerase (non-hydrolysing)